MEKPDSTALPRLDFAFWPEVPGETSREVVFQTIHEDDRAELERLGYEVVLLRTMPVSDDADVLLYTRTLLRGVVDGTVSLTKEQSEALELDMRHRQMLNKTAQGRSVNKKREKSLDEIIDWDDSRHAVATTTVVPLKQLQRFAEWLQENPIDESIRQIPSPPGDEPIQ